MIGRMAAAAAALLLLLAGCGGGGPAPVPTGTTGRFSGTDGGGVGAAVDFAGFDGTKREIQAALGRRGEPVTVGIVSLVNRTRDLRPIPTLWAVQPDGSMVTLPRAPMRLRGGRIVPMPDPGPYIPVQGAMAVYVVFPGPVERIRGIRMRVGDGPLVDLRAEPQERM